MLNKPLVQSSRGTAIVLSVVVVIALFYGAVGVRQYFYAAGVQQVPAETDSPAEDINPGDTGGTDSGGGTVEEVMPPGDTGGGTSGGTSSDSGGGASGGSGGTTGSSTDDGSSSGTASTGNDSSTSSDDTSASDQSSTPTKTTAVSNDSGRGLLEFFSGTAGEANPLLLYFVIPSFFLLVLILIMLFDTRRRVIDLQKDHDSTNPPTST